jgi:hypothetical protein
MDGAGRRMEEAKRLGDHLAQALDGFAAARGEAPCDLMVLLTGVAEFVGGFMASMALSFPDTFTPEVLDAWLAAVPSAVAVHLQAAQGRPPIMH